MSELKKLLEGVNVEWKSLSAIGKISGAGVDKKINSNERSIRLLNYMDIYRNRYITKNIPIMIVSASERKIEQCNILRGDIFFTPSSEVINDIGKSAVALEDMDGCVYSYHIMRLRLDASNISASMFVSYMLGSKFVQEQINKKAKGLTRFGLTKTQWENLQIPIPCPDNPEKSLKIQEEIVRILDSLSEETNQLNAALQKELNIHHKNHNFYRERLMNFEDRELKWKTLEEVAEFQNGKGHEKVINPEGKYIVVNSKFISTNGSVAKHSNVQITPLYKNDILIVMSDLPNGRALARTFLVTENDKYTLNQRIGRLTIKNTDSLNPTFLCYFLNRNEHLLKYNNGIDQTNLQKKQILDAKIPTVSVSEQLSIVAKLNDLNLTTANLVSEIQKEITLRNKQYEYYRDRLLSFPK